jgi:hypothetical protein
VPLDEEERKRKRGEGKDQSSNGTLKKRDWEDCLLVRQVTPNDHNTQQGEMMGPEVLMGKECCPMVLFLLSYSW